MEILTMRETPDIETASDNYASRFAGAAGAYFLRVQRKAVEKAIGINNSGLAIELGGGHGQLASQVAMSGFELIEFGSDKSCHDKLGERCTGTAMSFVTGNMTSLPFADQSADMVIHVRLISHIDEWKLLIAESCRVSRGAVVFDYPTLVSANALTPLMFKLKKNIEKNTRTYLSFTRRQLKKELKRHGFRISAHVPQFFLPMFIHRAMGGSSILQAMETFFRVTGLTSLFGSPVILRADREGST